MPGICLCSRLRKKAGTRLETPNPVITADFGMDGKTERLRVRLPRDLKSKEEKIDWRLRLRDTMGERNWRDTGKRRRGEEKPGRPWVVNLSADSMESGESYPNATIEYSLGFSDSVSFKMDSTRFAPRFGTRRRSALSRQARFPFRVVQRKWKRKLKGGH